MDTQRDRRANGHRTALLEGAIHCLQTVGYARTTARAVVEASGTNLGSIAYHYGSIEHLRDEALIEAASRWLAPIVQTATAGESTPDRLEEGLAVFMESLPRQRPLLTAFLEALAQADRKPALRARLAQGYDELRAALGRHLEPAAASLAIAIVDGLMIQWVIDPRRVDPSTLRAALRGIT